MLYKIALLISSTSLPFILNYFIKKRYKKLNSEISSNNFNYYYQCIFITMKNFECRGHIFEDIECSEHCSNKHLQTITKFIASAKYNISLCMYFLTISSISNAILQAHERGVAVRIITDATMIQMDPAKIHLLKNLHGIQVKVQLDDCSLMHHKFCLIDENNEDLARMFMGSLNLTLQGLTSNFDFILFTNNLSWIKEYSKEFEELWKSF